MGLAKMHEELKAGRMEQELEKLRSQQSEILSANSELMKELELKSKKIISMNGELTDLKKNIAELTAENKKLLVLADEIRKEAGRTITAVKSSCQEKEAEAEEKAVQAEKLREDMEARIEKKADELSREQVKNAKALFSSLAVFCLVFCGAVIVFHAFQSDRFLPDVLAFFLAFRDSLIWMIRQIQCICRLFAGMAEYNSGFYWFIYYTVEIIVLLIVFLASRHIISKLLGWCKFDKASLIVFLIGLAFVLVFDVIPFNLFGCLLLFMLTFMLIRHLSDW